MSKKAILTDIRSRIDSLERLLDEGDDAGISRNFDALEIPSIIESIVDYLQPQLLPYESAIYWFMFRKSILATADQYVRVSVRGMQVGVITSSSGQTSSLSYGAIKDALYGLEQKGVIAKSGDVTRDGTPYKVYLPDEISICQQLKSEKDAIKINESVVNVRRENDYYNIQENRLKIFERDGYKCQYCKKQLTRFSATLDHIQPVSRGGDNSYVNLITACLHCNSRRGNKAVMDVYANDQMKNL